jgi:hypothetical protein
VLETDILNKQIEYNSAKKIKVKHWGYIFSCFAVDNDNGKRTLNANYYISKVLECVLILSISYTITRVFIQNVPINLLPLLPRFPELWPLEHVLMRYYRD